MNLRLTEATFLGFGPVELVEASRVRLTGWRRGVALVVVFRRTDRVLFGF